MGNNWTTMLDNGSFIYGAEKNPDYFSSGNYRVFNNPVLLGVNYRTGVRSGLFVTDLELVTDGFSGAEGIGWQNIETIY
jgi:hypothetical protein